jgi:hypothetical protein
MPRSAGGVVIVRIDDHATGRSRTMPPTDPIRADRSHRDAGAVIADPPAPARNVISPATSVVPTNRLASCSAIMLAMTSTRLIPRRRHLTEEQWVCLEEALVEIGARHLARAKPGLTTQPAFLTCSTGESLTVW